MAGSLRVPRLGRLRGTVRVPGDKSISHRSLIFAALARGKSRIRGFLPSLDCLSTAACLERLGVSIRRLSPTSIEVEGNGFAGLTEPGDVLDAGNSGTTMRLLSGLLAGRPFHSVLTGDASLRRRPMGRVIDPLARMGCEIRGRAGGKYAPLSILGGDLRGIRTVLPVASAQVKSCLILAALQAHSPMVIVEPTPTRDHTERMLARMGARIRTRSLASRAIAPQSRAGTAGGTPAPETAGGGADAGARAVHVEPGDRLTPIDLHVPGDVSSALFPVVAALLLPGSRIRLTGVGLNPTRTAALEVLARMGAGVTAEVEDESAGEPVGCISVEAGGLKATTIAGAEVPILIDEVPILAVAATQAEGRTIIRDAAELRVKESDRIETLVAGLQAMGARVHALPDGMVIDGPSPLRGTALSSHGDHRIGMALYVAGLVASGRTTIDDPGAMDVSFPGFDRLMRRSGGR